MKSGCRTRTYELWSERKVPRLVAAAAEGLELECKVIMRRSRHRMGLLEKDVHRSEGGRMRETEGVE